MIKDFIKYWNKAKEEKNKKKLLAKARKIKKEKKIKELFEEHRKKLISETIKEKNKIYNEIRKNKIDNQEIIVINSIEIKPYIPKKIFGVEIPFFNKKISSYKTPVLYWDNSNQNLKFMGVDKKFNETLTLFEKENKETYIIKNETKPFFYKGKRILNLTPNFPLNLTIDVDNDKILGNSNQLNRLINNVFTFKLTEPLKPEVTGISGIIDLIKKNWIIILIGIIIYIVSQEEGLSKFLGF